MNACLLAAFYGENETLKVCACQYADRGSEMLFCMTQRPLSWLFLEYNLFDDSIAAPHFPHTRWCAMQLVAEAKADLTLKCRKTVSWILHCNDG